MTFQPRPPLHLATVVLVASCATLNATETDERVISAARGSYNFMTYLKDDKVNIVSKGGAVTLTGTVQDEFHRSLAEETLAGLPGVKSVNNQLSLSGDHGINPDATLKARVEAALLFHRQLSAVHTSVQVASGVVRLTGSARNQAEKLLVTRIVRNIEGIRRVRNQMSVE